MGNVAATPPSTGGGRYDQRCTIDDFMADLGLASALPHTGEADHAAVTTGTPVHLMNVQADAVRWALNLCGCELLMVELLGSDGPVEAQWRAAAAGFLTERLEACRRSSAERCLTHHHLVMLGWQWENVPHPAGWEQHATGGHLTLLVLDHAARRLWFFDPELENPTLPFARWVTDTPGLYDGYDRRRVTCRAGYYDSLLQIYGDGERGLCATLCLLVVAALWRCGPTADPDAVLCALAVWGVRLKEDRGAPGMARMQARLLEWQWQLGYARTRDDEHLAQALLGLRVAPTLRTHRRACGAFLPDGVCAAEAMQGWCHCYAHLTATLRLGGPAAADPP